MTDDAGIERLMTGPHAAIWAGKQSPRAPYSAAKLVHERGGVAILVNELAGEIGADLALLV